MQRHADPAGVRSLATATPSQSSQLTATERPAPLLRPSADLVNRDSVSDGVGKEWGGRATRGACRRKAEARQEDRSTAKEEAEGAGHAVGGLT